MTFLSKIYFRATGSLKRPLPRSEAEYERFKTVLKEAFNVPDRDDCWSTVSGQITSTPASEVKKSWAAIANAAKRLDINGLAHNQKMKHMLALQKRLEEATQKLAEEQKRDQEDAEKLKAQDAQPFDEPKHDHVVQTTSEATTTH